MKELYTWQKEHWVTLQSLRGRLPNGLLLKGHKGIGKLDLALNFAQSLLCNRPQPNGMSCQKCDSCHWFEQGNHPDFRFIQPGAMTVPDAMSVIDEGEEKSSTKKPSNEISVTQIRDLSAFSNLSAHCGNYRVVLIHPAEAMNKNAANSLLKTLEEPTDKLLFILVSHKPQQLQPTILSRCLGFMLPTPSRDVGTAWLKSRGVTNPDNALAQTGFAPLLALDWAESGVGSEERSILLDEMTQPERLDALDLADRLQRSTPVHVIHCLQQWCYDITSVKLAGSVRYFPEKIDVILNLANSVNLDALLRTNKELQDARRNALHPLNSRLFLESIFLSYRHIFTD